MNEIIYQKIQRLSEELKYIEDNRERFLNSLKTSLDTKKIVERSVYLCAEMVLDIADLLLIKNSLPKPLTYSEAIYKLGDNNIIPKEFAYRFVYIAGLRNFLSHDYLKDTVTELEKFLEAGLKDVKEFLGFLK